MDGILLLENEFVSFWCNICMNIVAAQGSCLDVLSLEFMQLLSPVLYRDDDRRLR